MRVLALASQKGGSGKTTLSGHLAVQAERAGAGPVVLIDIDPQASLADWWNERAAELPAFAQTTVARLAIVADRSEKAVAKHQPEPIAPTAPTPAAKPAKASRRRSALADGRRAAFTLRIDAERHLKLRLACTLQNRSAQMLVIEALDRLFAEEPTLAVLAAQITSKV